MVRFEGNFGKAGIKTAWEELTEHRRLDAQKEREKSAF